MRTGFQRLLHKTGNRSSIAGVELLAHAAHHEQLVDGTGLALARLHDLLVGDDPLTRHVALLRRDLAPCSHLAGRRKLLSRKLADALEPAVAFAFIGFETRRIAHLGELGIEPMKAPLALQFLLHMLVHAGKIDDVIGGIAQLGFRQGATRPVGEGIDLLKRHAALGADQGPIADLLRVPQKRRRNLRVEQRLGQHAHLVP